MLLASMSKMIDEIVQAFEDATGKKPKPAATPGFPGKALKRHDGAVVMQSEYRSITGKILYYTVKVAPEVVHAARDLASHMSAPGEEHWKAMERMVGYLLNIREEKFRYRRPEELREIIWTDAGFAACEDTRQSVSGAISTIGGTPTSWWSRKQPGVALSSAESEIHAYATACQEAMFTNMLLEELLGEPSKTAVIFEDKPRVHLFDQKSTRVSAHHTF